MTQVYIEQNCTIEHEGRRFTSGGAVVTPDHVVAYYVDGKGEVSSCVTTWHGETLGRACIVASWATPRSYVSSRMYQIEAIIDGIKYTGRGAGNGMVCKLRRKARQ